MNGKPVILGEDVAGKLIEIGKRYARRPQNKPDERPTRTSTQPANWQWVSVSSTTVTSGTQPGSIRVYDPSTDTWSSSGATIRVKQANGYVLATGQQYNARFGGLDGSGNPVFVTRDQSGFSGSVVPWIGCSSGTPTTETLTYEDGVLKTAV